MSPSDRPEHQVSHDEAKRVLDHHEPYADRVNPDEPWRYRCPVCDSPNVVIRRQDIPTMDRRKHTPRTRSHPGVGCKKCGNVMKESALLDVKHFRDAPASGKIDLGVVYSSSQDEFVEVPR